MKIDGFPYRIKAKNLSMDEMQWLTEQCGHDGWTLDQEQLGFKEEKYLAIYHLRWE